METDYPAAHSMDTTFFAVDAAGHVALFDSGENGHVPKEVEAYSESILWELYYSDQPGVALLRMSREQLANAVGIYCYDYDDEQLIDIAPYRLTDAPKKALHVDQLSPLLRQICKQIHFELIDFSQSELIQPMEWFPCVYWYHDRRIAYLASDGKTVRPISGMEDRFADFCKQFREENPEEAENLIFEGMKDEPK